MTMSRPATHLQGYDGMAALLMGFAAWPENAAEKALRRVAALYG